MKSPDSLDTKCFVCDQIVIGSYECIIHSYTQYSKVSVPVKISSLVGDDFIVVVDDNDVLCESCIQLVNQMDKLDEELFTVKDILSSFLAKKYHFSSSQIQGHNSNSDDIERDEFVQKLTSDTNLAKIRQLKCAVCGYQACGSSDFEKHLSDHSPTSIRDKINFSLKNKRKEKKIVSNRIVYFCVVCSQHFSSLKTTKIHMFQIHSIGSDSCEDQIGQIVYSLCLDCVDEESLLVKSDVDSVNLDRIIGNVTLKSISEDTIGAFHRLVQYICDRCGKVKDSKDEIKSHFGIHVELNTCTNVCYVCGEQTLDETTFKEHINSHEIESCSENVERLLKTGTKSKVICQHCLSEFCSIEVLKKHIENVRNEKNVNISKNGLKDCSRNLNYNVSMASHIEYSSENVSSLETKDFVASTFGGEPVNKCFIERTKMGACFTCTECNKEFPSSLKLKEHEILHTVKLGVLQCEYCLENLPKKYDLLLHIRNSHGDIRKTLLCPLCNRKCASRFALKRHVVRYHLVQKMRKTVRENYSEGTNLLSKANKLVTANSSRENCEILSTICNDSLKTQPDSVYYNCSSCDFKGSDEESIRIHSKDHKQITIDGASSDKKLSHELVGHSKLPHDGSINTQCPYCLKDCGDFLLDHLKEIHNVVYADLRCTECTLLFTNKTDFETHLAAHFELQFDHQNKDNSSKVSSSACDKLNLKENVNLIDEGEEENSFEKELANTLNSLGENTELNNFKFNCDISIKIESKNTVEERSATICQICKRECGSQSLLRKHSKTHASEYCGVACLFCQSELYDNVHLRVHIQDMHPGKNDCYCVHCDKYFSLPDECLEHMTVKHSSDKLCQICGKQFSVMKKYLFHKEYFHREELNCMFCNKEFKDVKKLKVHESSHKRNEGKTFQCDNCVKTFKTASGLRFHNLSHTGNYPFFCEYCGRGFVSTHHLDEHVANHTGEERFVCDVCGKRFKLYDTYHRHRNLHDNPYPKQCDICKKYFRNASRVSEHKRKVHTGERPYKCPFCPMTFNISSAYKVHLCIHTQKYPHNCNICGRGFTTRIKYATHLATKHGDFSVINDKKPNYRQVFPENYV